MSYEINTNKDFIYIIPIIIIIVIVYVILINKQNNLKPVVKGTVIENKQNKNMNNLEIGKEYKTESGLVYEVIKLGTGPKPDATNTVEVHYHGTLENGTVFDSSVQRGKTIEFGLNQVISG
jgi:FKBP-type peptidyl-prolyl cis-trans isomerase